MFSATFDFDRLCQHLMDVDRYLMVVGWMFDQGSGKYDLQRTVQLSILSC